MHTRHPFLLSVCLACACGALGVAANAAQASPFRGSAQAGSQPVTLTGCLEYGPRDTYVLATMDVPEHPDLSNEAALEREEVTAAEHSYELLPEKGEQFSQMIGAKVRANGTIRRVAAPASAAVGRGRGAATTPPMIEQLDASSVQKVAGSCGAQLTMFAM